jgi:hypothetical protein
LPEVNRLPTADDGVEGLLDFAGQFGTRRTFDFLTWVRFGGNKTVQAAITALARRMVGEEMTDSGADFATARRVVAERLGYSDTTRTHFYKILDQGQREPR